MAVNIKSYQQILSTMKRKLLAVTGLNDLHKGSILTTILEAAAQEDFNQYVSLLDILDSLSIDNLAGIDLDSKASEFNITRLSSTPSSGFVTITDPSFTKISTTIFVGASPPIIGDTVIKVADATDIPSGSIYIGEGTNNFEGPLAISSVTQVGDYWKLSLSNPLTKNHNVNEKVVLAQGNNRTINVGVTVSVPANTSSPEVSFTTRETVTIPDGDDRLSNVPIVCSQPGSKGNVGLGAISKFATAPFNGAAVTNPGPFSNGRDLETDQELRSRIKTTIRSLSKGTPTSILGALKGVVDADENKRILSAVLIEPTSITENSKLYIDDGTGFEPSFAGSGYESVIDDAAGTEKFFQLGNYPVVKAQVLSVAVHPFNIPDGSDLSYKVNGVEETIIFAKNDFLNPGAAKSFEVATAINNKATLIEARTAHNQTGVVIFSKSNSDEKIQVVGGAANDALQFPTNEVYTIKLYKNDRLLKKDGESASIESRPFSEWKKSLSSPQTLIIDVDSKPRQYIRISDGIFELSYNGTNYYTVTGPTTFVDLGSTVALGALDQWATVLNGIIAGARVTVTGNALTVESTTKNLDDSYIAILGSSSLVTNLVFNTTPSFGQSSDFALNRFSGQLELVKELDAGDNLSISSPNTRGEIISSKTPSGSFNLELDNGRKAVMYAVLDGNTTIRNLDTPIGATVSVANSAGKSRYTVSGAAPFANLQVGDYVAITNQTDGAWLSTYNTGLGVLSDDNIGDTITTSFSAPTTTYIITGALGRYAKLPQIGDTLTVSGMGGGNDGSFVVTGIPSDHEIEVENNGGSTDVVGQLITVEGGAWDKTNFQVSFPTLFKVTARASTWFEIENPNRIITEGPFNITRPKDIQAFSSDTVPQKIEFVDDTLSIDQAASAINSQAVGMSAEIFKTNYLRLFTNEQNSSGSIQLPILFGAANLLGLNIDPHSSIDSHFGYVESESEVGIRVNNLNGATTGADDVLDPFTSLNDSGRLFSVDGSNPGHLVGFLSKGNKSISAPIESINSDTSLSLRDNSYLSPLPATDTIGKEFLSYLNTGTLYQQFYPFDFNANDNLVVVVDGDEANTFNVPFARNGAVSAVTSTTQFNATDTDSNKASPPSFALTPWDIYNFEDYKVWLRAHNVINPAGANNAITYWAKNYGPTGEKIRIRYVYQSSPNQDIALSHVIDPEGTKISVALKTGASVAVDAQANSEFKIAASETTIRYTWQNIGTDPNFDPAWASTPHLLVVNSPNFNSLNNGTFLITAVGPGGVPGATWIEVSGGGIDLAISTKLGSDSGMAVFTLSGNTGTALTLAINEDAINKIVSCATSTGESGAGVAVSSTADDSVIAGESIIKDSSIDGVTTLSVVIDPPSGLATYSLDNSQTWKFIPEKEDVVVISGFGDADNNGTFKIVSATESTFVVNEKAGASGQSFTLSVVTSVLAKSWTSLFDGENWIKTFKTGGSPTFTLKKALSFTSIGGLYSLVTEPFKLIPTTGKNVFDHLNQKVVTALSSNANIERAGSGNKLQITTNTLGSDGSVWVTGGTANSLILPVKGSAQPDGSKLKVFIDSSSVGLFHSGEMVKIQNQALAKKLNEFDTATQVSVSREADNTKKYLLNGRTTGFTIGGGSPTLITITLVSGNTYRFTVAGDGNFSTVQIGDELQIVSGSPFNNPNEGSWPIVNVDVGGTYVDAIVPNGVPEAGIALGAVANFTVKVPFFTQWPNEFGATDISVEYLSRGIFRYRVTGGTAANFLTNGVSIDDYVIIDTPFSASNLGTFRVIGVTDDYFEIINPSGLEETASSIGSLAFTFYSANSAVIGDSLNVSVINDPAWFDKNNHGSFVIQSVGRDGNGFHYVHVQQVNYKQENVTLGVNNLKFFVKEGLPFESFRIIDNLSINPSDSTQASIYFATNSNRDRFSENNLSEIIAQNKLGFTTIKQVGSDGYQYWTGLLATAHHTVDGFDLNPITFPGIKAAGVQIEILPPLLQRIRLEIEVKPISGSSLLLLSDNIKSTVLAYVGALGVGDDVIISQIIQLVQVIPGVETVRFLYPLSDNNLPLDRIPIQSNEKAIAFEEDISIV